ncbi:hypothetical protein HI914_06336 [Erysiphe necator]|nr:hypothetical protein HI914_06336 [Erysiphe necator]
MSNGKNEIVGERINVHTKAIKKFTFIILLSKNFTGEVENLISLQQLSKISNFEIINPSIGSA